MKKDEIRRYPEARHILVMRNGHLYTFPVLDSDWNLFHPSYYSAAVRYILADAPPSPAQGIGLLTTEDRDNWARARKHLVSLGHNASLLEEADSALYAICLDDQWHHKDREHKVCAHSVRNLVHGLDGANRWFDKSFSLMVSTDGGIGINFEHAWGDGVAVMRVINELVEDERRNDFGLIAHNGSFDPAVVKRLEFEMDEASRDAIAAARDRYESTAKTVTFDGYILKGAGRADCRKHKVSPDSVMQAAFQAAHHRVKGTFVPVYESCSTAIYRHGRTETLRALTSESKTFVEALNRASESGSVGRNCKELQSLLKGASGKHMDLTKLAAQGQGWDRHLFALKDLCLKSGKQLPKLFQDPAYQGINRSVISTSTLSSHNMIHGGFCPVVPEGFGFGYQIRDDILGSYISSYHDSDGMKEAYKETMLDMQTLLKSS